MTRTRRFHFDTWGEASAFMLGFQVGQHGSKKRCCYDDDLSRDYSVQVEEDEQWPRPGPVPDNPAPF